MVYVFHTGIFARKTPSNDCFEEVLIDFSMLQDPGSLNLFPKIAPLQKTNSRSRESQQRVGRVVRNRRFGWSIKATHPLFS